MTYTIIVKSKGNRNNLFLEYLNKHLQKYIKNRVRVSHSIKVF